MKKSINVLIISATGSPVRQASIPTILLPLTALFCLAAAIALYWGFSDYLRLKSSARGIPALHSDLTIQTERIAEQQAQIIAFSNKIKLLNDQLAELHDFERKIRIIANLETDAEGTNLFGVGGSDPEDLDPQAMIEEDYRERIREMHAQISSIDHASHGQRRAFTSIIEQLEGKRNLLAATPSIRPSRGWISSSFGYRMSPFTGRRQFHGGLDIANHSGTPIIAPANGKIVFAGKKGLMGKMVIIDHGYGMVTRYGHIKTFIKKKGERVKRGDTFALMGNSGRSTGPHLHYEVRLNGVAINPTKYFLN